MICQEHNSIIQIILNLKWLLESVSASEAEIPTFIFFGVPRGYVKNIMEYVQCSLGYVKNIMGYVWCSQGYDKDAMG